MAHKTRLLAILFLFMIQPLQAQETHQDNGYLIYTLGKDTTMIGHYQLNGDEFAIVLNP